jgi:3-hydroxymyristoyl/3-hydroxydecanoyl-(acyl carrier protein) dehydratase
MPGALLIESLSQLGGVLIEQTLHAAGHVDSYALLTGVERAKFRHVVRPGDRVELEVEASTIDDLGSQLRGVARVEGRVVAEAHLTFATIRVTNERFVAQRRELLAALTATDGER